MVDGVVEMTNEERAQHVYDLVGEMIREVKEGRDIPPDIMISALRDIQDDMRVFGARAGGENDDRGRGKGEVVQ